MKIKPFRFGSVIVPAVALIAPISCSGISAEQKANAQREVETFLKKIIINHKSDSNYKIAFKEYKSYDMVYYLDYVLNQPSDVDNNLIHKYETKVIDNQVEVKLYLPFIKKAGDDITKLTNGRMMSYLHGDHFHWRFVTWEELPPTSQEVLGNQTMNVTLKFPIHNGGKIDWSHVNFYNLNIKDGISYYRKPIVVDLTKRSKDDKMISPSIKNHLKSETISDFRMNGKFLYELAEMSMSKFDSLTLQRFKNINEQSSREEIYNFIKTIVFDSKQLPIVDDIAAQLLFSFVKTPAYMDQIFRGNNNPNAEWQYNIYNKGVPLSDRSFDLGMALIKDVVSLNDATGTQDVESKIKVEKIKMDQALVSWWLANRPHDHTSALLCDPHLLAKLNHSPEDANVFFRNIAGATMETYTWMDSLHGTIPTYDASREVEVPWYYIDSPLRPGKKYYFNGQAAVMEILMDLWFAINEDPIDGSYFNNAETVRDQHDLRDIKPKFWDENKIMFPATVEKEMEPLTSFHVPAINFDLALEPIVGSDLYQFTGDRKIFGSSVGNVMDKDLVDYQTYLESVENDWK